MLSLSLTLLILAGCGPAVLTVPDSTGEVDPDPDPDPDSDVDSDPYVPVPGDAALNEMLALSSDGSSDWVELYNEGELEMDLEGWAITDHHGLVDPYVFEQGTVVPAEGFLVLLADGEDRVGENIHLSFRLAVAGETLTLLDEAGEVHDEVTFPELAAGSSWAAVPDGGDDWEVARPTPGESNDP
jgi:hypothetical protein